MKSILRGALSLGSLSWLPLTATLVACSGDDSTTPPPADGGGDATTGSDGGQGSGGDGGQGDDGGQANDGASDSPIPVTDGGTDAQGTGDGGVHSACVPGAPLSPTTDSCADSVCNGAFDSYCCVTTWDLDCVESAHTLCATTCPADPLADGGIAGFGGTRHAIKQIASRDNSSCAVDADGSLWCWGLEDILGDGAEQPTWFARRIVGLPVATKSVAMATGAICALGTDNGLRCWGRSPVGSTTTPVLTPSSTPVLTNVTGIAGDRTLGTASTSFVCGVLSNGDVDCWGENTSTLGPGVANNPSLTPEQVNLGDAPSTTATAVFAGGAGTCVLVGDAGTPTCWGDNTTGMLGHTGYGGTPPVVVQRACLPASDADGGFDDCANALQGIAKIAVGAGSTCVLDATHAVKCLGDNTSGQLGTGTAGGTFPSPQTVTGVTATDIAAGAAHACAAPVDATSPVVCWGSGESGELGPGLTDGGISATPLPVTGLVGVTQLVASTGSTCALKSDGTVWCWGTNVNGELGVGTTGAPSPIPVQVSFVSFP